MGQNNIPVKPGVSSGGIKSGSVSRDSSGTRTSRDSSGTITKVEEKVRVDPDTKLEVPRGTEGSVPGVKTTTYDRTAVQEQDIIEQAQRPNHVAMAIYQETLSPQSAVLLSDLQRQKDLQRQNDEFAPLSNEQRSQDNIRREIFITKGATGKSPGLKYFEETEGKRAFLVKNSKAVRESLGGEKYEQLFIKTQSTVEGSSFYQQFRTAQENRQIKKSLFTEEELKAQGKQEFQVLKENIFGQFRDFADVAKAPDQSFKDKVSNKFISGASIVTDAILPPGSPSVKVGYKAFKDVK